MAESHSRRAFSSDDYHQALWSNAPYAVAHVDKDGLLLDVNPQFCTLLGYAPAELIGHRYQEFTHPDDVRSEEGSALLVRDERIAAYRMIKRYRHKNGHWLTVTLDVRRIPNSGEFDHYVSYIDELGCGRANCFLVGGGAGQDTATPPIPTSLMGLVGRMTGAQITAIILALILLLTLVGQADVIAHVLESLTSKH